VKGKVQIQRELAGTFGKGIRNLDPPEAIAETNIFTLCPEALRFSQLFLSS
jgi:hypothetical protein